MKKFLLLWLSLSVLASAATDVAVIKKKAKAGNTKAIVELAHMSMNAQNGVEFDVEFIFKSFQKGAKAKSSRAHYGLAKCYVLGVGTDPNPEMAFKHAKKSADMKDRQGIRYLGNCYIYGRSVPKDTQKGIELTKKSIKMGNIMAEYSYAFYLTRTCKDNKSQQEGLNLIRDLIKRKHGASAHLMGMNYHDGKNGLKADRVEAMKHYRLAIEWGYADGYHQVGNMLLQDKKPGEAMGWLLKGVNRGSYSAYWTLAKILKKDPDMAEEPDQWIEFAEFAAIRGNKWAQNEVGDYYHKDAPDKKKDWVKASKYLLMSAKQGRCRSWDRLSDIYDGGKFGVKRDPMKVIEYCRPHFKHGYHSAQMLGTVLTTDPMFKGKKDLHIKGYAALLTAKKKGAKLSEKFMNELPEKLNFKEDDIAKAKALHKAGYPKSGGKVFANE